MSELLLFPIPDAYGRPLAVLRSEVERHHGLALAAVRKAEEAGEDDLGGDELAENFLACGRCQGLLGHWIVEWQERDAGDYDDEDNWSHPEGPLTKGEREMLRHYVAANDALHGLRIAINRLRARETTELREAGAVIHLQP